MLDVIDYTPGKSLLHRLNPVSKLAVAAAIITATFLAQSPFALMALLALTLGIGAYAGVARRLTGLLKVLLPIVAVMFTLQVAFTPTGEHIVAFATVDGVIGGLRACLRLVGVALPLVLMLSVTRLTDLANACVEVLHVPYRYAFTFTTALRFVPRLVGVALPLVLMLSVTRLTDLANACVEVLHVPYRYAFTFTTALRFVPVFTREMNAIMEAQTARGVHFDTGNPFKKLALMIPVCIPLLVTSVQKTDATALAAEQRGAARAHAQRDETHGPGQCLRGGPPRPLSLRVHVHHGPSIRPGVHARDERHHGGSNRARRAL